MDKPNEPVVIKKYANRRLYNTGASAYVTLEDLAEMVKKGDDFVVFDAKTGDEITRSVLTQIIFDQEGKGQNLLPIAFLRQLIRFYDDSLKSMVPTYLEFSIDLFAREQERLRKQMTDSFGVNKAFQALEEQAKQNMAVFDKTMRMFIPFARERNGAEAAEKEKKNGLLSKEEKADKGEVDALRREMEDMRRRLDRLSGEST